jgi:hypothetical protein
MRTYEFDVILKDITHVSDEEADLLFERGCDDAAPVGLDTFRPSGVFA